MFTQFMRASKYFTRRQKFSEVNSIETNTAESTLILKWYPDMSEKKASFYTFRFHVISTTQSIVKQK